MEHEPGEPAAHAVDRPDGHRADHAADPVPASLVPAPPPVSADLTELTAELDDLEAGLDALAAEVAAVDATRDGR